MSVLSLSVVGTATRVAIIGITLAIAVILARALGPTDLGRFFLFVQLVAILAVVADAGLSQSVAAFFGKDTDANRYRYGVVLRVLPISAAVTASVTAAILGVSHRRLLPQFPVRLLWLAFAALPLLLYSNVWTNMMAGMGRIREASAAQFAGSALWLLLTVVFVAGTHGGVLTAGAVYCLALLVQATLMAAMAVRIVGAPSGNCPSPGVGRDFLSFAARAYPGAIAYLLMIRLPAFLLNGFHGPAAVGIFGAGQQIVERAVVPIVAVQAATYRIMASSDREVATAAINRYVRLSVGAMAGVVMGGIVVAAPLVRLLLGGDYAAAASVCRLLFPGVLLLTCAVLLDGFFLNQLGRPGTLSLLAAAQAGLVVILGVLLIPRWGANGAALSLTLTEVVGTLVYIRWYQAVTGARLRDLLVADDADLRDVIRRSKAGLTRARGR